MQNVRNQRGARKLQERKGVVVGKAEIVERRKRDKERRGERKVKIKQCRSHNEEVGEEEEVIKYRKTRWM